MSASHRRMRMVSRGMFILFLLVVLTGCGPKPLPVVVNLDVEEDPAIWYVTTTGTDTAGSCHSPATACRTIQFVVDQAVNGDTIHIADGVYTGRVVVGGETHTDDLILNILGSGPATILENPDPGANIGDMKTVPYWGGVLNIQCNQCDGNVHISNLTIRNAMAANGGGIAVHYVSLTMDNVTIENTTAGNGGCLFVYGETKATLDQVILRGCHAADNGGGVYNDYASFLTLADSQLIHNAAGINGGGLFSAYGSTDLISGTVFENNTAGTFGGAIYGFGELDITGCGIRGNEASTGGGLFFAGGNVNLNFTTINANRASHGSGIDNEGAHLYLADVTVSGNEGYGFGIETAGADATFMAASMTIAENPNGGIGQRIGGTVTLFNTLLAGNGGANCNTEVAIGGANNLSSDNTCNFIGSDNQMGVEPRLGPLADNGGPTWTHALLPGSPALDRGTMNFSPGVDQRGIARPQDGNGDGQLGYDIGAFEFMVHATIQQPDQVFLPPQEPPALFVPDQPTNCRQGPGVVYPAMTSIPAGAAFAVDGKNETGDWVRLWLGEEKNCWVRVDLGVLHGDSLQIVLRESPPTPVPTERPTEVPTAIVVCSQYTTQSACEAQLQCFWGPVPPTGSPGCMSR